MARSPGSRDPDDGEDDKPEASASEEVTEERPGAVGARPRRAGGARSANQTSQRPGGSGRSTKWAVDRLDDREKRFSFAASGGALLFGVIIYAVENNAHFHPQKGQLSPQTVLVVGLVGGALLLGATLLGRRAPVGFVALFTGLAFSNSSLFLALPFLALAIWILYRSFKIQREVAAAARAARVESKASSPRGSRSPASTTKPGPSSKGKGRASSSTRPEANKRYTPKRPPSPAPKPSRRERKATKASD
jgi:hypothetical protein